MIKNILQVVRKKAQVIWKKIQEPKMVRFILTALLILLITLAYHKPLMELYEDYIITPLLKPFESNIGVGLITVVFLLACSWDIVKRCKIRYQFSKYWIGGLCFVTTLLLICRLCSSYEYVIWTWIFAYVDVITFVCFAYVVLALFNCYKKEKAAKDEPIGTLLEDNPIEREKEDVFSLKGEAQKIAKEIRARNRAKTSSIAITAPWGGGKSSFLNLIREQINEDEFEIVYFVPRDSKSVQTIQEDFFSMIACVLAKYDSRCSHIMKDYMASLQLIDNRSIVERVLSIYRIWDKDSLKDSIKESFAALKKRVLVIIDDFDRLSKEEILEVLKLIDGNAAFTNLIFLTAYDKEQVNRVLGDTYQTPDACFVDKFFDVEFAIPFRKCEVISDYIKATLCKQLAANDSEGENIRRVLTDQTSIFEEYIPTLRDAKRYINQVVLDFEPIRGEVFVSDFLLLQLVKYRYPELYKGIFKQKYLETGDEFSLFGNNILYLKTDDDLENGNEVDKILSVLKLSFTQMDDNDKNTYRRICERKSFYNYFANQIYSALRISEMKVLFEMELTEAKMKIDKWAVSKDEIEDFVQYLANQDMGSFNEASFIRYVDLVTYTADKVPNLQAYALFLKLIALQNVEKYISKYKLDKESYKSRLLEIIKSEGSKLYIAKELHVDYTNGKPKEEEYLIKDADIWPFIIDKFKAAANDPATDEQWLQELLYRCIESKKDAFGEVVYNQECLCAYRERIEKAPAFYISNFIVPRWFEGSNYHCFTCEHCCREIFGGETQLEAFLKKCKKDELAGSLLAWNCWQLYKANNYMPIDYRNIGPVNEMIKNDLVEEVKMLDKMKQIEIVISEINIEDQTLTSEELSKLSGLLSKNKKELKNIQLPIALKEKILNEIDFKLKTLSQIEKAQER
ncbi:KAP family P-loop NTPase fold protein [Alloprevotella tannerae]|uniref:KAP family P-loop domain protein n=1 Tax=Alloprevotella tannerae ATCC 51259 TaxID=626522 RepID=C9LDI6_9BACT|nr:P-loop NTPase fold protein [Alloprevotella tannerae]EEX72854.1 KAP family P-loop domain protein [Alloprevotella tannerae ATCC 51259]